MRAQEVNMIVNNIPDKWWIYLFSLNWNVKATFSYSPKHFHMKWITWVWLNMALRAEYCTNTMIQNNSDYCVCIECVLYNTRMTLDKHWHRFWQIPYLNWVTYSGLNNYKAPTDEEITFRHTLRSCLMICCWSDVVRGLQWLRWESVLLCDTFTASTGTPWPLESIRPLSGHTKYRLIEENFWHCALLFGWLSYSSATLLWTQINHGESISSAGSKW